MGAAAQVGSPPRGTARALSPAPGALDTLGPPPEARGQILPGHGQRWDGVVPGDGAAC